MGVILENVFVKVHFVGKFQAEGLWRYYKKNYFTFTEAALQRCF